MHTRFTGVKRVPSFQGNGPAEPASAASAFSHSSFFLPLLVLLFHTSSNSWLLLNSDKLPTTNSYSQCSYNGSISVSSIATIGIIPEEKKIAQSASNLSPRPWKWEHKGNLFLISSSGTCHYGKPSWEGYSEGRVIKFCFKVHFLPRAIHVSGIKLLASEGLSV